MVTLGSQHAYLKPKYWHDHKAKCKNSRSHHELITFRSINLVRGIFFTIGRNKALKGKIGWDLPLRVVISISKQTSDNQEIFV